MTYVAHSWQTGDTITEDLLNAIEQAVAAAYSRANHSGTQAASTVTGLASVATSGNYTDLAGTPTLSTVAQTGAYGDLTGRPSLATVASSGNYGDLAGRPTLAAVASSGSYADLTGSPSLAPVASSGDYNDLINKPAALTSYAALPAGTTITVVKDATTGWPSRPTSRADLVVQWKGADPSPAIVSSGTGGMLDNVDVRFVTS